MAVCDMEYLQLLAYIYVVLTGNYPSLTDQSCKKNL